MLNTETGPSRESILRRAPIPDVVMQETAMGGLIRLLSEIGETSMFQSQVH
ncbi:hypothetical protein SAMN05444000_12641 [Shimia gijangensis]|uniref:Uncharacterized protein n=1 Tax=Shimia gijangensis TaxID=1470563 RepID=A0A1M6RTE0_9RHOB|nr:hypothetical protein SAMN05444000_12641 [Shimia gijangensis]